MGKQSLRVMCDRWQLYQSSQLLSARSQPWRGLAT